MNKKTWLIVFAVVILGAIVYIAGMDNKGGQQTVFDPANATYIVEGQSVTLVNGKAEVPAAPGSASMVTTAIFGQPVSGDLNGDGTADAAVMLVQNSGGSGTFYYIAAAINSKDRAHGTNAILLGDRIAPQTVEVSSETIIANYADRKPGEPMTTTPSVGISKYITFDGTQLVAVPAGATAGERCGGNMANAPICAIGYHCAPTPGLHLPFGDVGGTCVAN